MWPQFLVGIILWTCQEYLPHLLCVILCDSYRCISQHLSQSHGCPVCKTTLQPLNSIHPNFSCEFFANACLGGLDLLLFSILVNSVVAKYRQQQASIQAKSKVCINWNKGTPLLDILQTSSPKVQDVAGLIDKIDQKGIMHAWSVPLWCCL